MARGRTRPPRPPRRPPRTIGLDSGGHARACIDVIELENRYRIAGLVEKNGSTVEDHLGYSVVGIDDDLPELRKQFKNSLITVGQIQSATTRVRLFTVLSDLHFHLPVIVSPQAHVSSHSRVGAGTIIMHGAIVNANAVIGKNCIINNKALIEHDAVVGDHCHIATGAIVNGKVNIGSENFIGSGAVTKQSISIGERCVIGAGAVIKTNVEANRVIKN